MFPTHSFVHMKWSRNNIDFYCYRSGTLNSNRVNSKLQFIQSFCEIFNRFLLLPPANEVCQIPIITARKRSLGQVNIFAPVCHSVHRGFCPIACWDTPPRPEAGTLPRSRHPPGPEAGTPQTRGRYPRCAVYAGRYRQQASGMHPTGMQSCFMFKMHG